jgi:hypothetical protein
MHPETQATRQAAVYDSAEFLLLYPYIPKALSQLNYTRETSNKAPTSRERFTPEIPRITMTKAFLGMPGLLRRAQSNDSCGRLVLPKHPHHLPRKISLALELLSSGNIA